MESDEDRLTYALAAVAGALFLSRQLKGDLNRLLRLAVAVIPNCSAASVALLADGSPTTVAVTDRVALEVDLVQYDNSEGPCITALGGQVIRVGFVPNDERFPHFAVGAADRRVLSVLSMPLRHQGTVVGTMNCYSHSAEAFDTEAERLAWIFAAEAATVVLSSEVYGQAVTARDDLQRQKDADAVVAQAEGYLMQTNDVTAQQARALLSHASHINAESLLGAAQRILDAIEHYRDDGPGESPPPLP